MSSNELFDDPEDRIARALMMRGHGQGTAVPYSETVPHRFDRSVDFNGAPQPSNRALSALAGAIIGGAGVGGGFALGGLSDVMNPSRLHRSSGNAGQMMRDALVGATRAGGKGGVIGASLGGLAGYLADVDGDEMSRERSNYREFSNPDGSEERIGRGMSGPQNTDGPRWSRPPKVYGP